MSERKDNSRKHGYWIHTKVKNDRSVSGYFTLAECSCSRCGFIVASEKERCPHCRAVMDGERR